MSEKARDEAHEKSRKKAKSKPRAESSSRARSGARASRGTRSGRGARSAAGSSSNEAGAHDDAAARAALRDSDKLYYRIGEVSKLTSVKAHVLRYWETEFRWMAPPKSRSKQRLYRKRDIEFVLLLKRLLWDERYTIAGARQRIQDLGLEEALALLDQPLSVKGARPGAESAADEERGAPQAEWISLRAALDEMQGELLALRGLLQEGP